MPIHKLSADERFVPFERTPFPDLEKVLEDWIEKNPHLVLEGEDLAIFARQPRTAFDKYLDLLAVDRTGATVIVELKRGETPRDVVAQAVEYAAWVDGLSLDQLNDIAHDYAQKRGIAADGIADIYRQAFSDGQDGSGDSDGDVSDKVTYNNRQRIVIVAEHIRDEVEQTLRYMRTRFGADVYGVEFSVHRAGGEILISTTSVVGREQVSKPTQAGTPRERETDEQILAKVKTEFLRRAVRDLEEWVDDSGDSGLSIEHSAGSEHYLRYLGVTWLYYYYASNWMYMSAYGASDDEVESLRRGLSKPESLLKPNPQGNWRFHVVTDGDLEVVKRFILARLTARREQGQP